VETELRSDIFGATLSRRGLLRGGGALAVSFALAGDAACAAAPGPKTTLDPALPGSWIEIRADNTITIRCGKPDFGQGTPFTAYRQIVAEELYASFEAITTVHQGDTDRTPDGSGAFDFLSRGSPNLRKAAAYTYQALLDLGAERLGTPKAQLVGKDGAFESGGRRVTYGELVTGAQLDLKIPVAGDLFNKVGLVITGNPPMKPAAQYTVIGRSYPNSASAAKVMAKEVWAASLRLPGMLHARVVHPKTLGSTLVSVGALDRKAFPNTQVVVKGNRVAVVAPTEWEAIQASQQVAGVTKWTDWKGLPGSEDLFAHLRACDWKTTPEQKSFKSKGDVAAASAGAAKTLKATYEVPYLKHAPIGPAVAVADVRKDGMVMVYAPSQNPQGLRSQIALMLGTSVDKVVVRALAGAGQFGRSNGGNAGAEDDAVMLSKELGRPVRVQWMRAEDLQWSSQSAAAFADVEISLGPDGKIVGYQADHHMPPLSDDRLIGALVAGLPTIESPSANPKSNPFSTTLNRVLDVWVYDRVPAVLERGHGTAQIGETASPLAVGLRGKSMRTPTQFQQVFARELALTEAAALAGADPLQFRIDHATEPRVIGVLEAVRDASGWKARPSPAPGARATGTVQGRGVSVVFRADSYWACACEISFALETGKITVLTYTVAVDPGIVINPLQLQRQVEGGTVMGMSQALFEEARFDRSGVTVDDWSSYPIFTMADLPEIKVVLLNNPKVGRYGGGSEAANALAAPALAGALFDATGKVLRRLPLRADYVLTALKA